MCMYVCVHTFDAIPIGRPKYFTIHAILNYVKLGWSPPRGPAPSLLPPRAHARRWHRERPPLQSPAVPHGHRWTHAALALEPKSGCHLGNKGRWQVQMKGKGAGKLVHCMDHIIVDGYWRDFLWIFEDWLQRLIQKCGRYDFIVVPGPSRTYVGFAVEGEACCCG